MFVAELLSVPQGRAAMKTFALAALCLTACDDASVTRGPADGSAGTVDGPLEIVDAADLDGGTRGPTDATLNVGVGGDATAPSGEGGTVTACAGATLPPATLSCTGLYADIVGKTLAPGVRSYQPAVPLWSDGAQKARWIQLPPGTTIDVTDPNEWTFPVGTKIWKEFSRNGSRVETRLFQKVGNGPPPYWVHATYAWNADESEATTSGGGDITLAADGGTYHIPTFAECEQCHNGRIDHILGFEQISLGLSGAQGLTLTQLASEGLIAPAPSQTVLTLGDDGTGLAAGALAWIHINCGVTCHNANSTATAYGVGMRLRLDSALLDGRPLTVATVDPLRTTIGVAAVSPGWAQPRQWTRIVPGDPGDSLLVQLISNRGTNNPVGGQMPPIATSIVDTADVATVADWVAAMPPAIDGGSDGGMDAAIGTNVDADTDALAADAGD
jgi:hypothetical protein